jgi:hypothetical protein
MSGGKVIFGQTDTIRWALDINDRAWNGAINQNITEILLDEKGCSYFNQDKKLKLSYPWNKLLLTQQPWYSCYWTIMKTKPIQIDVWEEYYLSFTTDKRFTKIYHSKVNFFDAEGNLMIIKWYNTSMGYNISNQIYDFEYEIPQEEWSKEFEFIFTTPVWAKTMRIEFWAKQRQDTPSTIRIYDVMLKKYKDIPGLDLITLVPTSAMSRITDLVISWNISISQLRIPFSPYRRSSDPQSKQYISNIFNNGYVVSGNTTSQVTFFPQKLYILWICISIVSFVSLMVFVIRKSHQSSSIPYPQ